MLNLPDELSERLRESAARLNRSESSLALGVLSLFLDDEARFIEAVQDGVRALDEGRSRPFAEFKADFRKKMAERQASK